MKIINFNNYLKEIILIISILLLSIILGFLYYSNYPENTHSSNDFIFYIFFYDLIFITIIIILSKYNIINKIFNFIINKIIANKNKLLYCIFFILIISFLFFLIELFISKYIINSYFIWQRFLFMTISGISLFFIFLFKGKPEKIFLSLSLLIGLLYVVTLPISLVSWDEESHYKWSVQQSSFLKTYLTQADANIKSLPLNDYYNKDTRKIKIKERNDDDKIFYNFIKKETNNLYLLIAHIPSSIGIFIGRCLGLPWSVKFIFGRFMNILVYSFVIYFAIKKIPYGKYIISVIALTPTIFFIASNYSYDQWVFAWLLLGLSYYIYELHNPDKKIENKNIFIMFLSFFLGLGPKSIYFPLIFILYFLKEKKFPNYERFNKYIISVSVLIIFVILSFALPFLINTKSTTDLRGGVDVSSGTQLNWILTNPIEYTKILIKFLINYLNLRNTSDFLSLFAYLGYINFYSTYILIIFLIIVTFTDENKQSIYINTKIKFVFLISCFFTIILISTALYISFTPVGSSTINGVQPRYLLPFLCPILLLLRKSNIIRSENIKIYSIIVFIISSYFLLSGLWSVCISKYN